MTTNKQDSKLNLKCFSCKKNTMFRNQAGSLTCSNCGQLVFPCSAEKHLEILNLLFDLKDATK